MRIFSNHDSFNIENTRFIHTLFLSITDMSSSTVITFYWVYVQHGVYYLNFRGTFPKPRRLTHHFDVIWMYIYYTSALRLTALLRLRTLVSTLESSSFEREKITYFEIVCFFVSIKFCPQHNPV